MGQCMERFLNKTQEVKILIAGLDLAGKTTILYRLKYGDVFVREPVPTVGFNVETIHHQGFNFSTWDLSGKEKNRRMWMHYYKGTRAVIFVVDSNDRDEDRIEECKEELWKILGEDALKGCILLVLANKQDLPNTMSTQEITEKLNLNTIKDRSWHLQGTCATSGEGLYEGLDWLSSTLTQQR